MAVINVSVNVPSAQFDNLQNDPRILVKRVTDAIRSAADGLWTGSDVVINTSGTRPFCTFTMGSVAAGNTAVVDGVTFTAAASPTGNQFLSGAGANAAAADFVRSFNASTTAKLKGRFIAKSAAAVVTIEHIAPYSDGTDITCSATGNVTASGANFTAGASNLPVVIRQAPTVA